MRSSQILFSLVFIDSHGRKQQYAKMKPGKFFQLLFQIHFSRDKSQFFSLRLLKPTTDSSLNKQVILTSLDHHFYDSNVNVGRISESFPK